MWQAADAFATARVASALVRACWAAKDLAAVMEHVTTLCKKRGQSKRATVAVIRQALRYVDALRGESDGMLATAVEAPPRPAAASGAGAGNSSGESESKESKEDGDSSKKPSSSSSAADGDDDAMDPTEPVPFREGEAVAAAAGKSLRDARMALIRSLREVTEGRIWVEVERARLTRALAEVHEREGRVSEASETLQEAAVETYNSMTLSEKIDFMLEQMRLCEATADWVRMGIISNKVQRKALNKPEHEARKLRFYTSLSSLHEQRREALSLADDFAAILECASVREDEARCHDVLGRVAVYLALAPWEETLTVRWHALLKDKRLDALPECRALLRDLTTAEVIAFPRDEVRALVRSPVFSGLSDARASAPSAAALSVADSAGASRGERWWGVLHRRIVQHNLRTVSRYYSRIRFTRLSDLLALTPEACERELRDLVTAKDLWARFDRPAGIISFRRREPPAEVLSRWGADLSRVLGLVERTTHLINKEIMVHTYARRATESAADEQH